MAAYKSSYKLIPDMVCCARCGKLSPKDSMERHHPAGRHKDSFCFTFMLHTECHQWVHEFPGKATLLGLLHKGRNSRPFTRADAEHLVKLCPFPPTYALNTIQ